MQTVWMRLLWVVVATLCLLVFPARSVGQQPAAEQAPVAAPAPAPASAPAPGGLPAGSPVGAPAEGQPAGADQLPPPSPMPMMLMFGCIFLIFYFLVWRPQRKQQQERDQMLKGIKKNDRVVTTGGLLGVVTSVRDDEITLKVDEAQKVRIRFTRAAVGAILARAGAADEKPKEAKAQESK